MSAPTDRRDAVIRVLLSRWERGPATMIEALGDAAARLDIVGYTTTARRRVQDAAPRVSGADGGEAGERGGAADHAARG